MRKLVWVGIVGILAGSVAGWALHRPATDPSPEPRAQTQDADSSPAQPALRTVTLNPDAVKDMGLAVTTLKAVRHAPQLQTTAVVLSPQGLATLSAAYFADAGKLSMARANLAVASSEYRRLNVLYHEDQTTSLKALQAARGTLESSRAQTNAALLQLHLDELVVEQQWGPVLAKSLLARSPVFKRILADREWLVEITLDASATHHLPEAVTLTAPSGSELSARLISSFPQTNPVIQGLNFLYVIPARPGFAPGLNLSAEIPAGPARSGVVIPAAAVVWSTGEAWAYKETAPGHFERLLVSTEDPIAGGWFVTEGFAPGDQVVTRAAEELFSAETQPSSGGGGDEGDDD
jgi:multidrug efflux system membrane fusion protein